ncbi:ABC transporter substrate-binding protein [Ottowia thiooxydans]|uniref:Peptide/nickel transport system substrate-binding protein n=1 Tax=Ottowia thiooxydans TaxID=219182 RepID=A0ABV2Q878_9BURK
MKPTRRLALSSILGATLAFAAVPASAQSPAAASTFRLVPTSELKVLDPTWTTAVVTRNHGYMIYDTLFGTDAKGKIQPQMVESFTTSSDGKTWTFKLRPSLAFHDGKPVTAEDVLASLARWAKRDPMGQRMYAAMAKAEAVSSNSFRFIFNEPYGAVLESLGKPSSLVPFIMPKRMADTPADQQVSEHVGSGPYTFKADEFRPGERTVYLKNEKYVPRAEAPSGTTGGKVVKVARVEWVVLKDAQTQVNALVNGEVDLLEAVPFEHYNALKANNRITVAEAAGGQYLLRFNHLVPPFNDVRVRQAAMLSMNQEALLKTQVGIPALYKTCLSVYPCGSPLASNKTPGLSEKPQFSKAKELLKAAGYKGQPVVLLHATDNSSLAKLPPLVAQLLRQGGFVVDLKSMDWGSVVARRAKKEPADQGGWNAFVTYWGAEDALSPLNYAPLSANGEAGWFGWASDERLEQLRASFAQATTDAERKKLGEDIQFRAYEIGAFAPLGELMRPMAYRKGAISGVLAGSTNVYWNVSKP